MVMQMQAFNINDEKFFDEENLCGSIVTFGSVNSMKHPHREHREPGGGRQGSHARSDILVIHNV